MDAMNDEMRSYYIRDLNRLIENIKEIPEGRLWETPQGVENSCGVLVQHLVGNLNHFIGEGLGKTGYIRTRDKEFSRTESSKKELIKNVEALKLSLDSIFDALENDTLDEEYPMELPFDATTGGFLLHLYGHLNYHLGQINYLRRLQSSG